MLILLTKEMLEIIMSLMIFLALLKIKSLGVRAKSMKEALQKFLKHFHQKKQGLLYAQEKLEMPGLKYLKQLGNLVI
jgi:hypothetical protein